MCQICMSVHRVRPSGNDSDGDNSDDILADEELDLTNDMLSDVLQSRIGDKQRDADLA